MQAHPRPPGRLPRFLRDQQGSATMETMLALPMILGLFLISVDTGIATMNASLLHRAVDMTARDLRSGAITDTSLATLRQSMCNRLAMVPDCTGQLRVQVVRIDRTSYDLSATGTDCADRVTAFTPARAPTVGTQNGLVLLSACMMASPLAPDMLANIYTVSAETVLATQA